MITRYLIQEWNEGIGEWENIRIYENEQLAEVYRLERIKDNVDELNIIIDEVEYVR